ncbi:MAG TPA: adenylyltransferase/cytidyltransferase family protein [Candidatus Acidoferrales bacterium]|nr:adenylyltransferase/cytidyltransferase family protein [Candidatus Acidoferrales bacterium]
MGQVVSQSELISYRGRWKGAGKGVVCASGCFDLLHPGHIRLLEQARSLGDILVVALESDAAARKRFGPREAAPGNGAKKNAPRPITPAAERAEILAALAAVDYVVEFDEPSPRSFLEAFLPDVFVEGSASRRDVASPEAGALEALGCKVVRVPFEPGYSTALLIQRITESRA